MVRVTPFAVGVVAFGRAFLTAIACDNGAVEVHRHRAHLDLREEPPLQGREHRSVACLRELAEEPAVGALARQAVVTLKTGMEVSGHGCPAEWLLG